MVEEIKQDTRVDSIKVSKNGKGVYSFEVKRYYDNCEDDPKLVIQSIEVIYDRLKEKFSNKTFSGEYNNVVDSK